MGKDYYEILGLVKGASDDEIVEAFRALSFKYHPECNTSPGAALQFHDVAEAYDVLADELKREVFDQYGEEGLKYGFPGSEGGPNWYYPYNYHGDPLLTFAQFIKSGSGNHAVQDPAVEHDVYVSVRDIMNGCTKYFTIARKVLKADGTTRVEEKCLSFIIKPGCSAGTKYVFKREGDQGPNIIPADIIFIIKDMHNALYVREGSNLKYTAKITLKQALCGAVVNIPLLNGRQLPLNLQNEIITPTTVKILPGQGLPVPNTYFQSGDMIINFKIKFPSTLSNPAKFILYNSMK